MGNEDLLIKWPIDSKEELFMIIPAVKYVAQMNRQIDSIFLKMSTEEAEVFSILSSLT